MRSHVARLRFLRVLAFGFWLAPSAIQAALAPCYHTRAEIGVFLDSLKTLDSERGLNIVHVDTIGWSRGDKLGERYPLYAVTIASNPEVLQDKPTALIIGQVHAEEVVGMEMILRLMWDIVDRFGLYSVMVDNTQMVFVPTANPDGLEVVSRDSLDETWRKNGYYPAEMDGQPCNVHPGPGGDSCGVDLNRNFDFNWIYGDTLWRPARPGYPEEFDYYRGPAPFSEPETQAIRDLALRIHPTVSVVYHASRSGNNAEVGIVAWEWYSNGTSRLAPDNATIGLFVRTYCDLLIKQGEGNLPFDPVFGGGRNGNLQDWFYAKLGCLQINTELGPPETIQPPCPLLQQKIDSYTSSLKWLLRRTLNQSALEDRGFTPLTIHTYDAITGEPVSAEWRNLLTWSPVLGPWYTSELFGSATTLLVQGNAQLLFRKEGYATITRPVTVSPNSGTERLDVPMQPLPRHTLTLSLQDDASGPVAGRVYLDGEFPRWIDVPHGQTTISVPEGDYRLMAVANAPDHLILWRSVHLAGDHSEWFSLPAATPRYRTDFNSGQSGWFTGGSGNAWRAATDTSAQNMGGTLTTEPTLSIFAGGQYANNLNTWVQCPAPLQLGGANTAALSFWRRGRMDIPSDSLIVEISPDGETWQQAAGYADLELAWTQSFVNLSNWAGQDVRLRFRFMSDDVLGDLGIHIDNLAVLAGVDTTLPLPPAGPVYSYRITGAYPNPFNPQTTITYDVATGGSVTLVVFNTLGQEVRRFNPHPLAAGAQRLAWDGTTTDGSPVSTGLYFIQLQAGTSLSTHKLMLLR